LGDFILTCVAMACRSTSPVGEIIVGQEGPKNCISTTLLLMFLIHQRVKCYYCGLDVASASAQELSTRGQGLSTCRSVPEKKKKKKKGADQPLTLGLWLHEAGGAAPGEVHLLPHAPRSAFSLFLARLFMLNFTAGLSRLRISILSKMMCFGGGRRTRERIPTANHIFAQG